MGNEWSLFNIQIGSIAYRNTVCLSVLRDRSHSSRKCGDDDGRRNELILGMSEGFHEGTGDNFPNYDPGTGRNLKMVNDA